MSYGEQAHVYYMYQKLLCGKLLEVSGKMRTVGSEWHSGLGTPARQEGGLLGLWGFPACPGPAQKTSGKAGLQASPRYMDVWTDAGSRQEGQKVT